jgi:hypothetical protein
MGVALEVAEHDSTRLIDNDALGRKGACRGIVVIEGTLWSKPHPESLRHNALASKFSFSNTRLCTNAVQCLDLIQKLLQPDLFDTSLFRSSHILLCDRQC